MFWKILRPLHLFSWPLHMALAPLLVALAQALAPEKMNLFSRLSGTYDICLILKSAQARCESNDISIATQIFLLARQRLE